MVVYVIEHVPTHRCYVGITTGKLRVRIQQHCVADLYVDKMIRELGEENFRVDLLDICQNSQELGRCEKFWIKALNCIRPLGFNCTFGGDGSPGYRHSDKTKMKMSKTRKGHPVPQNVRDKISKSTKGRKVSQKTRKLLSKAHTGKKHTEQAKQNMSKARKGLKPSPEAVEKTAAKLRGRKHTEQARRNMSEGQRGRKQTPQTIAKRTAKTKGRKRSAEVRQRISENHAKRRPVICIETGIVYHSLTEASEKMHLTRKYISDVCKGFRDNIKGFHFKFV